MSSYQVVNAPQRSFSLLWATHDQTIYWCRFRKLCVYKFQLLRNNYVLKQEPRIVLKKSIYFLLSWPAPFIWCDQWLKYPQQLIGCMCPSIHSTFRGVHANPRCQCSSVKIFTGSEMPFLCSWIKCILIDFWLLRYGVCLRDPKGCCGGRPSRLNPHLRW